MSRNSTILTIWYQNFSKNNVFVHKGWLQAADHDSPTLTHRYCPRNIFCELSITGFDPCRWLGPLKAMQLPHKKQSALKQQPHSNL